MSVNNQPGSSFDDLLKSLGEVANQADTLAKAAPDAADDENVAAAAADAGVNVDGAAGAGGNDEDLEDDVGGGEGGDLKKSDDGMVDATELLKSLMARQETTDGTLAKALTSLTGVMSKQNDMIKSLQTEVAALRNQGRGRKTMLAVSEKQPIGDLAKSAAAAAEGEGKITPDELLAKSAAAFAAGKISGVEHNTVDVCLRNGWAIDAGVLTKIAHA